VLRLPIAVHTAKTAKSLGTWQSSPQVFFSFVVLLVPLASLPLRISPLCADPFLYLSMFFSLYFRWRVVSRIRERVRIPFFERCFHAFLICPQSHFPCVRPRGVSRGSLTRLPQSPLSPFLVIGLADDVYKKDFVGGLSSAGSPEHPPW